MFLSSKHCLRKKRLKGANIISWKSQSMRLYHLKSKNQETHLIFTHRRWISMEDELFEV
jgi:hypothetical protein